MGGLKEGDVLVPDHCADVPQAIAAVKHGGTVYIRKGISSISFSDKRVLFVIILPASRHIQVGRRAGCSKAHARARRTQPGRRLARRHWPAHLGGQVWSTARHACTQGPPLNRDPAHRWCGKRVDAQPSLAGCLVLRLPLHRPSGTAAVRQDSRMSKGAARACRREGREGVC